MSVPNAFDFLKEFGCPVLENDFSKNMFYNHSKITIKSIFQNKTIFLWGHSEAQYSLRKSYQDLWRTLYARHKRVQPPFKNYNQYIKAPKTCTLVFLLREHARREKFSQFSSLLALITTCSFYNFFVIFHPARLMQPAQIGQVSAHHK